MLEYYYASDRMRRRLKQNRLAAFIEEAACRFRKDGYTFSYARGCLLTMSYFGDWLEGYEIPVRRVTMDHSKDFMALFVPPRFRGRPQDAAPATKRKAARAALRLVVTLIHERHPVAHAQSPAQIEVAAYLDYLRTNRGLTEGSISHHQQCLGEFLAHCFAEGQVRVAEITPVCIHKYVDALPRTKSNSKRRQVCCALRGYFRFLELRGEAVGRLAAVVPMVHGARAALSPKVLTPAHVQRLLRSVDRSTGAGRRNYAAILCMCDLGMRVGDVARLTLDDVDWHKGAVLVANRKGNRPYRLPLPKRVGTALAEYLANGRPASQFREMFLRHARPFGVPATPASLEAAIQRQWIKAGLHDTFSGTHILRHSAATRMKQKGIPLKTIADVLGHSSMQTTVLYAQVDLPALRRTAQPWPGGKS